MASEKKPPAGLKYGKEWRKLNPAEVTDPEARALAQEHERLCLVAEAKRQELKAALNRIGRAKGILTVSESYVISRNSKAETTYNIRIGAEVSSTPSDF
jgi:hypothetical protein